MRTTFAVTPIFAALTAVAKDCRVLLVLSTVMVAAVLAVSGVKVPPESHVPSSICTVSAEMASVSDVYPKKASVWLAAS